eukprot:943181_1
MVNRERRSEQEHNPRIQTLRRRVSAGAEEVRDEHRKGEMNHRNNGDRRIDRKNGFEQSRRPSDFSSQMPMKSRKRRSMTPETTNISLKRTRTGRSRSPAHRNVIHSVRDNKPKDRTNKSSSFQHIHSHGDDRRPTQPLVNRVRSKPSQSNGNDSLGGQTRKRYRDPEALNVPRKSRDAVMRWNEQREDMGMGRNKRQRDTGTSRGERSGDWEMNRKKRRLDSTSAMNRKEQRGDNTTEMNSKEPRGDNTTEMNSKEPRGDNAVVMNRKKRRVDSTSAMNRKEQRGDNTTEMNSKEPRGDNITEINSKEPRGDNAVVMNRKKRRVDSTSAMN